MRIETAISAANSSTTNLSAGATFTGNSESMAGLHAISVTVIASGSGILYMEQSQDNVTWDVSDSFVIVASTLESHQVPAKALYYRTRVYNNSGSAYTSFRLQTVLGGIPSGSDTSKLSSDLDTDLIASVVKAVIHGKQDSGSFIPAAMTAEGHLEAAIHAPTLPFGSVHAESIYPVFQTDAVYGVKLNQSTASTSGSGTATASNSSFVCSTGTTIYSFGSLQSRKRLRYRAGQGVIGRFSAVFTAGVASSILVAGIGHAEDGVYIGYNGTQFGILYSQRGVREVQTLTITTASSTTENITVTLGGVANTVAVTNSANIQRTVWEISQGTYIGWKAEAIGSTVVFVKDSVGNATGTFSITASTAIGTFAETKAGVAATETWTYQSAFNGDKLDGTGASGVTLDPTKYNVYQIGLQYLGAGTITFKAEVCGTDGNNADFVTFHTIKNPNTLTDTTFGNPAFPFTMAAYSAGSTTNLSVKCGSYAGFIEGQKHLHGNRFTYTAQSTGVSAAAYTDLFTIRNTRYYGSRSNQSVIELLSVSCAIKHTSPVTLYLIRNGSLTGNPNFSQYASESCSYYDTAATAVTFSTNDQIMWSGQLGETGNFLFAFDDEVTLQPGEWLTVAARAATGTPAYVLATLNTREDQ